MGCDVADDPTLRALLWAVLDDPDDDLPRLAYADRLEEVGDSGRGEFVRVQCALARWPCECDSEERVYHDECRCKEKADLRRREIKLLTALRPRLLAELPAGLRWSVTLGRHPVPPQEEYLHAYTARGFVESVALPCADFLAHAAALFSCKPIRAVRLTDREPVKVEGAESYRWTDQKGVAWGLPAELFGLLLPDPNCVRVRDGTILAYREYESEAHALAGLSGACVRYGREAARGR